MPLALAGLDVERDEALTEQPTARTMAAVVIAGRKLHRQVYHPELFVDGHLRPHADVACVGPRPVLPRLVAELASLRQRVEDPEPFAGARVVAADIALLVRAALRRAAGKMGRANHDYVLRDDGRRVQPDLTGLEIDRLVHLRLQVDDAARAETGDAPARLRVEGHHLVTGGYVDDPLLLAVGPVRRPSPREPAGRRLAALAFVQTVHPQHFARRGVERDYRASRAGRRVEDAVHHQRRGLEIELGTRPERVGLEAPGDLQVVEVVAVDLIERPVAAAREVATICRPLAIARTDLTDQAGVRRREQGHDRQD